MAKLFREHYFVADVAVFPGGRDGLVGAVRTPAAPLRLCADADANASAGNSRHRRFLDLDPTIVRLATHRRASPVSCRFTGESLRWCRVGIAIPTRLKKIADQRQGPMTKTRIGSIRPRASCWTS